MSGVAQSLGISIPIPTANPLGTWDVAEDTESAYVMARIADVDAHLAGNAGVRVVRTRDAVSGYQTGPGGAGVLPNAFSQGYVDTLPSVNLRYEIGDGLYLRGAVAKTVTRPDFNQLSPSLTLNPAQLKGAAGNPDLLPVRADSLDLAVERYSGESGAIHLTAFAKIVDGFVTTILQSESHYGLNYLVSRPQNANTAHLHGIEAGYHQFYDFLPGWLRGLGLQANYTYTYSETFNANLKQDVPLQSLSRNSYNLIGMCELERLSLRLAYNWRDKFLTGVAAVNGLGALPVYNKAYGWLDASFSYRVSDRLTLSVEGTNLLRTLRSTYYGVETRPDARWLNDRQLSLTATLRM